MRVIPLTLLLATLALAGGMLVSQPTFAQDDADEDKYSNTRKTPAMREKVYNVLSEAQELAEAGNTAEALRKLGEVQKMKDLNSYELAQMWNFYGFIYFGEENYTEAVKAYEKVLAQENLPEVMETQTIYALAQLYFVAENYPKAVESLQRWFRTAQNPGPEAYVLLSQGLYQLKKYKEAIDPLLTAIRLAKEQGKDVKENWYLLLRTYYYELKDYKRMMDVLEELLLRWPKKDYWMQISGVYGELGEESKQLIAYELAYMQGFFTRGSEIVTLAQLYLQAKVPYKAAKVLQDGLDKGIVEANASNYKLLSQAWVLAKEDERAIPALEQAARLTGDGDLDYVLAQSYANLDRWDDTVTAARRALEKGGLRRADSVNVLIGMALYNQKKYEESKAAFRAAARDERSARLAAQWVGHIEGEQEREAQLRDAMVQSP